MALRHGLLLIRLILDCVQYERLLTTC